jgi:ABC-type amino acid transport substrate-binding protein
MKNLMLIIGVLISILAYPKEWRIVALDNPPYAFLEDGKVCGSAINLVRELMSSLAVPYEIEIVPWSRALRMIETGDAALALHASRNDERSQYALYTDIPVVEEIYHLYKRPEERLYNDKGRLDISGRKLGVQRGYNYPEGLASFKKQVEVVTVDHVSQALWMLHAGRIDLFVGDRRPVQYWQKKLNIKVSIVSAHHLNSGESLVLGRLQTYLILPKTPPYFEALKEINLQLSLISQRFEGDSQIDLATRVMKKHKAEALATLCVN